MTILKFKLERALLLLGLGGLLSIANAAETPAAPANLTVTQQPAWLDELSLGVKEAYDNNVYLSGVDAKYLPASYTVPAGSVAALENHGSWLTTLSPKVGVNFAPLFGHQSLLKTLTLAYAPDFVFYHEAPSESYDAHRFAATVKGRADAFSLSLDEKFVYVDGNSVAPTYPNAYVNAYGTAGLRERRDQIQDRTTFTCQYDWQHWFIRPTASLLDYNLMTEQLNVTGYQNYASRYDVNGGPDFGYKINSKLALTLGYRYGHQYQQQFSFSPYSSSSDYQRALLGFEGKPWHWLTVKLQGGPDFRDYQADSAGHITPVNDHRLVTYYGEASLVATVTAKDTVTFKYKQWQWVSSTGKIPYFDSTYDLSYHRQFTEKLGWDLGGKILSSDYRSGNLTACYRDDWQYTVATGVGYAFNPHCSVSLAYQYDLGQNVLDGVPNPDTRSFDHQLVSFGTVVKF